MKYDRFVGQVQSRARLGTSGEAVRAIRATLEVLGQRLAGNQAGHLAAQLPDEVGYYLMQAPNDGERFDLTEFYDRVSRHGNQDLPDAVFQARVVMSVVQEAVTPGEFEHLRAQLPAEYNPLFETEDIQQPTG